VNADQWNALSPAQQQQLQEALIARGALKPGSVIVGDPSVAPQGPEPPVLPRGNQVEGANPACVAACLAAYELEVPYCASLGGGLGAVCWAAIMAECAACIGLCAAEG